MRIFIFNLKINGNKSKIQIYAKDYTEAYNCVILIGNCSVNEFCFDKIVNSCNPDKWYYNHIVF